MKPIKFFGVNTIARGIPQLNIPDLPIMDDGNNLISCYELSDDDIQQLISTRKLWIVRKEAPIFVVTTPTVIKPLSIQKLEN